MWNNFHSEWWLCRVSLAKLELYSSDFPSLPGPGWGWVTKKHGWDLKTRREAAAIDPKGLCGVPSTIAAHPCGHLSVGTLAEGGRLGSLFSLFESQARIHASPFWKLPTLPRGGGERQTQFQFFFPVPHFFPTAHWANEQWLQDYHNSLLQISPALQACKT